jgi:hypothetical protein
MIKIAVFIVCFLPMLAMSQGTTPGWQEFSLGKPPLSLRLPGMPTAQKAALPPQAMSYISQYEGYYLQDDPGGLVVTIMHVIYANNVIADPKGAAEGTNGQWEATGSKVAVLNTSDTKVSGRIALQERGKLVMQGQEHDFMDIIVVEGSKLWQIIIMVPAKNATLKSTMEKIASSVTFR